MDSTTQPRGADVGVVTVDDQAHFRCAAGDVIAATPGFTTVGEASSGQEALAIMESAAPQLVLLDIRMPEMDGIETARRIKAEHPEVVVVLVTIQGRDEVPTAASDCGAAALVYKQEFKPSLLRRIWSEHGPKSD